MPSAEQKHGVRERLRAVRREEAPHPQEHARHGEGQEARRPEGGRQKVCQGERLDNVQLQLFPEEKRGAPGKFNLQIVAMRDVKLRYNNPPNISHKLPM